VYAWDVTKSEGGASPFMSIKRVAVLVWKHSKFFSSPPGFAIPLSGALWGLIPALVARFTSEKAETLLSVYMYFHIPFTVSIIAFGMCLALIIEERIKRTGELLFATPTTVSEYLGSIWLVGFIIGALIAYIGIIIFAIINGFVFLSRFPGLIYLSPCITVVAWTSAGVSLGVIWVKPGWLKKIRFSVIAFAPVITLFALAEMGQVPQFLMWIPEIQPSLTFWFVASLWLSLLLILLSRRFEVRGLVC